jgi:hypothetical protein
MSDTPECAAGVTAAPPTSGGLGRPFHRLWAGSTLSAYGDGMWLAAVPLSPRR